jgi:hypothetical protein
MKEEVTVQRKPLLDRHFFLQTEIENCLLGQ